MRYTSRTLSYQTARSIAGAAMKAAHGQLRLERCRALLRELDPERPPALVHAREFRWQYRALRERVHLYSERLAADDGSSDAYDLEKAEMAIELSLTYFSDVLSARAAHEDDEGGDA